MKEMSNKFNSPNLRFLLGDVRDLSRLKLATKKVDIIDQELHEVKEDHQVTSNQILDALRSK